LNTFDIDISSLEQMKKLSKIGLVRGDVREEWLLEQNFTNLHSVTQHSQNIERLLMGRVPVIVYEKQGLYYLCKKLNIDVSLFKPVYAINESKVFIVMSKKTSPEKVKIWKEAFLQLKTEGEIKRISLVWQAKLRKEFNIESKISQEILVF
jgi:ABC-type amino acid transport substrate-binding protein